MSVVQLLDEGWGEVVEVLVGSLGVEEVDPFEGGDLDMVHVSPGPVSVDHLGLERSDRGLSQRVVERVTDSRMKSRLAVAALNNAVARRGDVAGCIIHTDYAEVGVKPRNRDLACV